MKQENPYRIYFASSTTSFKGSLEPTIVFIPTSDRWNDFTHRTVFKCHILNTKHLRRFSTELHLAFLDTKETAVDYVRNKLKGLSRLESTDLPFFYTMLPSLDSYRRVVAEMDRDEAVKFLFVINDLVATKTKKVPTWFERATTSDAFKFSFMRRSQTFFAFHNATSILKGEEHKVESGISKFLMLRFQLPSFDNPHELEFQFEHDSQISKRIAVIIGKNGVGKSQALSNFARSLIRDDNKLRTQGEARPSVNRLIAISGPGETRTTFPTSRVRSRIPYRKIILDLTSTAQTETGLGSVLIQLARSKEKVREHDRWNLFCNAVSSLLKLDEVFVRQRRSRRRADSTSKARPIALSDFRPTSEQAGLALWGRIDPTAALCRFIDGKTLPLSSGESTFIRFAAQACLFIENGTLLLFDEPETHLHPNLITQFVGLLDELLKMTSSFAVLATHSAYFVREVPRSQVLILKENGRKIEVVPPRLKTLGADIGAISFFVFGDELYGRLLGELSKRLSKSRRDPEVLLDQFEADLSDEAYMFLRRELSI